MSQRKSDHINMAASSVPASFISDERFYYEPLLNPHPTTEITADFLGKSMRHPLWISSMTGGTAEAGVINHRLAEASAEFGLGMGLGSCRSLLRSDEFFDDFNLRPIIGQQLPFYANLGIAQIEKMLDRGESERIHELVSRLDTDGLFIHVNPTQEWLQPEGDRFKRPAIEIIEEFSQVVNGAYRLIVKEVGQGIGPKSLEKLLGMNIDGIEFAAFGGTNFATIELMRKRDGEAAHLYPLATFGHNANEMTEMINRIVSQHPEINKQLIISGGINNFLDGYYYTEKSVLPAVYGMAGAVLKQARESKQALVDFIKAEIQGYQYAKAFLRLRG